MTSLSLVAAPGTSSLPPTDVEIPPAPQKLSGLVPFVFYVHTVETTYTASVLVSLLGIFTNAASLKAFLAMGDVFKDGVALTFFLLALTDLSVCCLSLSWGVCALGNFVEQHVNRFYRPAPPAPAGSSSVRYQLETRQLFAFPIDLSMVAVYSYVACSIFSMTTSLITTYLAVMRCLCVARPLTFRASLSPGKTALLFGAFFTFSLVVRVPTLALTDVKVIFNPRINASRPAMWSHPTRELVKDMTWSVVDIPIPLAAEVTLTICVIVMGRALKASANFRNKLASGMTSNSSDAHEKVDQSSSNPGKEETNGAISEDAAPIKLSKKEARIIQQLVFISLLFLCCNIPKLIRIVIDSAEPEFSIRGRYRYLYGIVFTIQIIFEILNSSLNFFIYYKFNSRFKESCISFCNC
ncbi:chemosensory receptor C [Elysia marginata]|uniref:Chemosensory receptor C n=1 Tax=Elysia marginata TaxID=1093978 RepID=A0AAV4JX34_9GAST|nr:chemosensory receptor C [Elysia marginata]